ncbi:nitrate ABC transporter permease [Flavobacterium sp. L1I52]|uniref:Nitrate ABC transporter permease n=1 Tax=Flavobacterium pokkalii TaxID=1940408 RepID=A0ABR7UVB7_9FLAO|nr:ABC transporter permease [Flavobacterium pokkalii]KQB42156.1 Nitrate ABC transporter, permease component [Flavobacterium daejeonense]MBD0726198.1 nitrate ABC transporter permease [Flavobacterium pokkalii]
MKTMTIKTVKFIGLGYLEPLIRLIAGEEVKKNAKEAFKKIMIPLLSVFFFILLWQSFSDYLNNVESEMKIEKALQDQGPEAAKKLEECIASGDISCRPNSLPSPLMVVGALGKLWDDHLLLSSKKADFIQQYAAVNEERLAKGETEIKYTGRPSFVDQIFTSLKTVFAGFLLSIIIAIPMGILLGLSETLRTSFNWIVQIFKPVSPVVWLLLVSMIVKTILANVDVEKSFVISFISVGLCSMWATLVNTSAGVSSVDKDYINVAKVLQLGTYQKIFKIILPSSFPMIFTGLRITLSVAWMVLIAIELLAQSPGLGSFVWEEFQNGSSDSNSKIIVAMFVIGLIGFMLDRIMMIFQKLLTFNN